MKPRKYKITMPNGTAMPPATRWVPTVLLRESDHRSSWVVAGPVLHEDEFTSSGNTVTIHNDDRFPYSALGGFVLAVDPNAPPPPTASFTTTPASGTAPLTVTFTDTSTGAPTSWSWSFGDGGTSTAQSPTHTFTAAGTYTVQLTATNAAGPSSTTASITVAPTPSAAPWNKATMLGSDQLHPNDAGMSCLADNYVAALAAAGKTPAAGTVCTAYGDSWTAQDIHNTPGQRAIQQLRDRLSLSLTNQAVGGYKTGDCAGRAIGTTGTFTPGTGGLVVVAGAGLNDLSQTDTTQVRAAATNYLRALFAVLCAAARIEQTAFTYSGTWSTQANSLGTSSGGSNNIANADGAACSYTITTPGTYYLLLIGADGSSMVGGVWTVTQGGTTLATVDTNQQTVNTGAVFTSGYGPMAVRLDNVQAGPLTMTFSTAGRSGAQGFLDALLPLSSTPPTILAVKPVEVLIGSYQKPGLLEHIREQYDALAAEFGTSVVVCDPEQQPTADFTATPVTGTAPATVAFTDTSRGSIASWSWSFGDGATSTSQNPSHTYTNPGTYTVTLTVANSVGISDTSARTGLVTVAAPPRTQVQLMTTVGGTTNPVVDADGSLVLTEIP